MTKDEKIKIKRNAEIRAFLGQFTPNAEDLYPKLFAVGLYMVGLVYVAIRSKGIADFTRNIELISPIYLEVFTHTVKYYLIAGAIGLVVLAVYPFGRKSTEEALKSIGMVNRGDMAPMLLRKLRDKDNPHVTLWTFRTNSIPLKVWEDKRLEIEAALGVTIVDIRYARGNQRVILSTVPAESDLPTMLPWKDKYLSQKSFELVLGQSYTGLVKVNLADIPHILLGGSTGSGKSVLLKVLILQCLKKDAYVAIADFKGGVDFPPKWRGQCKMCFAEKDLLEVLDLYISVLQKRKELFSEAGVPNLNEYNRLTGRDFPRYILACDEIAEVLDKTGLNKEQKELVAQIESRLSMIARQGRAFGIHLILATQRPDATILSGQIRNNIDCRVCGRADNVLSHIILDSTDAADLIPKHAKGRFLLHDGTVFQGFWLGEANL